MRAFLVSGPALILTLVNGRSEVESTVTSWIGVLGYQRTTRWLGIPVYQNFVDLGSELPLLSSISASPISILGSLLSVQNVQIVTLMVAIVSVAACITLSELRPKNWTQNSFAQLVLLAPIGHYFLANDWTDLALSYLGFFSVALVACDAALMHSFGRNRHFFGLSLGTFLLVIGHLGYIGVPLVSLAALGLSLSLSKALSRGFDVSYRHILFIICLSVLSALILLPSVLYLLKLGFVSNPRPRSWRIVLFESLSVGVLDLGFIAREVFAGRLDVVGFFYRAFGIRSQVWLWPVFVLALLVVRRVKERNSPSNVHAALTLQGVAVAGLAIGLIPLLSSDWSYPLRPSADYQYRDATLIFAFMAVALGGSAAEESRVDRKRWDSSARRFNGWANLGARWLVAIAPVLIASAVVFALWANPGGVHAERGVSPIARSDQQVCERLEPDGVVWASYEIWRSVQPGTFQRSKSCSLVALVSSGRNSIGGWLKMRQTVLDGSVDPTLEERVDTFDNPFEGEFEFADVFLDWAESAEDGGTELVVHVAKRSVGSQSFQRCQDGECVGTIRTSRVGWIEVGWNFDAQLFASDGSELRRSPRGLLEIYSNRDGQVTEIRYRTRWGQRLAILASWALFAILVLSPLPLPRRRRRP